MRNRKLIIKHVIDYITVRNIYEIMSKVGLDGSWADHGFG